MKTELEQKIYNTLKELMMASYDDTGSIGKRYRRADAIGIPYAITIDDETLKNKTVTVRDRDSMEQVTVTIEELINFIRK